MDDQSSPDVDSLQGVIDNNVMPGLISVLTIAATDGVLSVQRQAGLASPALRFDFLLGVHLHHLLMNTFYPVFPG